MSAKFTLGEWRSEQDEGGVWQVMSVSDGSVVDVCDVWTNEDDARLIASAHDLLEAITRLRGSFEFGEIVGIDPDGCKRALEFIKAAIAKATGEPQ